MANASFFNKITLESVENAFKKNGYKYCTNGDYNLNIFGIRNQDDKDANTFNDVVGVTYKENGKWVLKKYDATTDPGFTGRLSPINSKGVAILVPGQHSGCWQLGLHQGKYRALVQRKPVPVYRDNNRDKKLDFDEKSIDVGMHGINIHRSSATGTSVRVDGWSQGCSVLANYLNFQEFISICDKSAKIYGNSFTYTLFTQSQFF